MNRTPKGFGDEEEDSRKRERPEALNEQISTQERKKKVPRTQKTEHERTKTRPTPQQLEGATPPLFLLNEHPSRIPCLRLTSSMTDEMDRPTVVINGPAFAPSERAVPLLVQGYPEGGTFTWSKKGGRQLYQGPQLGINILPSAKGRYTYHVLYEFNEQKSKSEHHTLRRYQLEVEGDTSKPSGEVATLRVRSGPSGGLYEWQVAEGNGALSSAEGEEILVSATGPGRVTVEARCTLGGEALYSDWVAHTVLFTGAAVKVTPCRDELTVVLDKDGNPWDGYPILSFDIEGAELAGHVFDVQIALGSASGLSPSPGPLDTWTPDAHRDVRMTKTLFSSWTAGARPTLDGSGKATITMPVEWWVDLARLTPADVQTTQLYFQVLVMEPFATQPKATSAMGCVLVHNNLVSFEVSSIGYVEGGRKKSVTMTFQVKEAGTSAMYTILQWNKGSSRRWSNDNKVTYAKCVDYDIRHDCHFPVWSLDRRSHKDPRYANGTYTVSPDQKSATATDKPGSPALGSGARYGYYCMDFQTRLYLNFEVPHGITLTQKVRNNPKSRGQPDWGVVIGGISHKDPQPIVLKQVEWTTRILQAREERTVNVTHPESWEGP